MILALYRGVLGPTAIDRIMGVNIIGTKTAILLVIIGMIYGRVDMFVDIALAYALLSFIATIATARYFKQRKDLATIDTTHYFSQQKNLVVLKLKKLWKIRKHSSNA